MKIYKIILVALAILNTVEATEVTLNEASCLDIIGGIWNNNICTIDPATYTISSDTIFTIETGTSLFIGDNTKGSATGSIINYGTINIKGTIINYAWLKNYGTINNNGLISSIDKFWNYNIINNYGTLEELYYALFNYGTINNYGIFNFIGMVQNVGTINNEGTSYGLPSFNGGTFKNACNGIIIDYIPKKPEPNDVIQEKCISVPEFPTIAFPIVSVIGLVLILNRKKTRN